MKTQKAIAFFLLLLAMMAMPQETVAKDKKVKYLGHNYQGAVDNNKAPAGNGTMNVNGLLIEGIFDTHSATDAEVWRTSYLGNSTTKFNGTITYDDSEYITLKAGGIITTTYFGYNENDKKYAKETLKEDRKVNRDNFEPKELKLSYSFKPEISQELTPPLELAIDYSISLRANKNDEIVFIDLSDKDKENLRRVSGYKDSQGRIWNYVHNDNNHEYTVKYPDGSWYSYVYVRDSKVGDIWEIHYPDGKVIKKDIKDEIDLGNSFLVDTQRGADNFIKLKNQSSIGFSDGYVKVHSNYYDFGAISSKEGEKIIKENLLSDLKIDKFYITTADGFRTIIGEFENGKYTSKVEKKKAETVAMNNDAKARIASFTRRFGFDPMGKSLKELVKVGRSYKLLVDFFNFYNDWTKDDLTCPYWLKLFVDRGNTKGYDMRSCGKDVGVVWVTGDKVSKVVWYI